GKSPEQVFADFKEFAALIHGKLPECEIVFLAWGATPLRLAQRDKEDTYNKLVKEFCGRTPHMIFADVTGIVLDKDGKPRPELFEPDRLHYNADGYKLLAEAVRPYLPK